MTPEAGKHFAVIQPWIETIQSFDTIKAAHDYAVDHEHDGPAFLVEVVASFHFEGCKPIAESGFIDGLPDQEELHALVRQHFGPPDARHDATQQPTEGTT